MDFQSFSDGINFMYILPFSSKKALFESTYFSKKTFSRLKYKNNIIRYLNDNFPNVRYKISRRPKLETANVVSRANVRRWWGGPPSQQH